MPVPFPADPVPEPEPETALKGDADAPVTTGFVPFKLPFPAVPVSA